MTLNPANLRKSRVSKNLRNEKVAEAGLEPPGESSQNGGVPTKRAAKCAAEPNVDADLAMLIQSWPRLSRLVRGQILNLVGPAYID